MHCMEMEWWWRNALCRLQTECETRLGRAWCRTGWHWARHEALWVSTLLLQTPLSVSSTRPFVLCATTRRSSTRHAISPSARTNNNLVLTLQHLTRFLSSAVSSRLSLFCVPLFSLSSAGRLLYSLSYDVLFSPSPLARAGRCNALQSDDNKLSLAICAHLVFCRTTSLLD
jgi:hypothetical protein